MVQSVDSANCKQTAIKNVEQGRGSNGSPDGIIHFDSRNGESIGAPSSIENSVRRRVKESTETENCGEGSSGESEGEVLACSGNASFPRRSGCLAARTKSRLSEPVEDDDRKAEKRMKSGAIASTGRSGEVEDLTGEDVPDEYMNNKISKLALLEFAGLILITSVLICSLSIPVVRRKTLWDLKLWKWEVMILVLICGRLVSGWVIRVLVFLVERNFVLRKRVLYFVYGLRTAVRNCLWFGLVLVAWHFIFDKKVEKETRGKILPYVTKGLVCILVGTIIWLVKTLIVKVLASSFHVNAFLDRIQESLFNQYVIETLSAHPLVHPRSLNQQERVTKNTVSASLGAKRGVSRGLQGSPKVRRSPRFTETFSNKSEEEITIDSLHKLNQKNISAWNMKRLMNIVLHGSLYTLDECISSSEIQTECQAREAAKKIFSNVAKNGSSYIYMEDLMHFMREDEASKTMSIFEGAAEYGGINKASLKNWMVNAFRERRALALSLNDTNTAVEDLHRLLGILVAFIIVIIWLLIIGIEVNHFLVVVSSQLLLVAFIFGNTCKNVFEAIVFLFVIHPFDVGDRCEVDGVQMIVEEMKILTTVFLRYDNQKIVYPNSVLATKAISNYYRSPDMGDAVDFCIHVSTPFDKIAAMKEKIKGYIEGKLDHWYPDHMFVMKDVEGLNQIRIAVWVTHRINHQDMGERWTRRALLVEEMVTIFKELDIGYRLLPLDVNVRRMPGCL